MRETPKYFPVSCLVRSQCPPSQNSLCFSRLNFLRRLCRPRPRSSSWASSLARENSPDFASFSFYTQARCSSGVLRHKLIGYFCCACRPRSDWPTPGANQSTSDATQSVFFCSSPSSPRTSQTKALCFCAEQKVNSQIKAGFYSSTDCQHLDPWLALSFSEFGLVADRPQEEEHACHLPPTYSICHPPVTPLT